MYNKRGPFVGTRTCHSNSKLYYLCHLASLFYPLSSPTPTCVPPTYPLIYAGPIFINSMKKSSKTGDNQPLSVCQVSRTKDNR